MKAHSFGKSTPNHLVAKLLADAFFAQGDALPLASTAGHLPAREVHSVPPAPDDGGGAAESALDDERLRVSFSFNLLGKWAHTAATR